MPRFFTGAPLGDTFTATGETGRHIAKSLRMRPGDTLTLCDGKGTDYHSEITEITGETVLLRILSQSPSQTEPALRVHLYQCLPKADKLELVVQKAVELGVFALYPVLSTRCVVNLAGKEEKKRERWNKIALEAAKQSGRGRVPTVEKCLPFAEMLTAAPGLKLFCYEGGGDSLRTLLAKDDNQDISILIGPEGGFSPEEATAALAAGFRAATLGPRILRTETAPLAALSIVLYEKGEL